MNNRLLLNHDEPTQVLNGGGLTKAGYEATRIDDAKFTDWVDQKREKGVERREHERFQIKNDAFALIRSTSAAPIRIQGRSMGSIACAVFRVNPHKIGKIENISVDGLAFCYVDMKARSISELVLDILMADRGFHLANIPFKTVADHAIADEMHIGSFAMRQLRLQFKKLSLNQRAELEYFICNHCSK
jgi:hypothetical protein